MDQDTLIRVGDAVAAQLADVDRMTATDCTTELERVLFDRLATVRRQLEALGLRFDSCWGSYLAE